MEDKQFLLSIEEGKPNWSSYDFSSFPAIQWKLFNLQQLKEQNPLKHKENYRLLETKLLTMV